MLPENIFNITCVLDCLPAKRFFPNAHNMKTLFSISYLFTDQFQFKTVKETSVDEELYALHLEKRFCPLIDYPGRTFRPPDPVGYSSEYAGKSPYPAGKHGKPLEHGRLNKRIDKLLRTYAKYDLNFKSWPKSKFDFVCQSINPEQVRSLILSDADDTLPSLTYLSIGICSMSQLKEILFSTSILTKLNVQLIADTTPAGGTLLLSSEIRQLKIELAKKSNMKYDDIQILFEWMPKLEKFTFIAAKGLTFIEEKQWSIYCDYHGLENVGYDIIFGDAHFYTLPYSDAQFRLSLSTVTTPKACKDKYSTTKNFHLSIDSRYNTKITHYYFPQLDSLTIRNLHKLIPMDNFIDLSQVKHLTVTRNNDINSEDFFSYILVHSTKLESLTLSWYTLVQITKNFTDHRVFSLLKKQIKNLYLLNMTANYDEDKSIPTEMLIKLFSTNLEKLIASVASMGDILLIVNEMFNLYSIKIECSPLITMMNKNGLSLWLRQNVPRLKSFTFQIQLGMGTRVYLLLWISN
ncbi:unnamed protein product [Rotaria magnacalcarata]|uniref:Uncharacterized protein n=1 Tax=Rotaria magnacalcarata TaxID=392030 RepID=A0A816MXY3_9BILA|nr:unnamed protein product [Rotaria magnacalcarata]